MQTGNKKMRNLKVGDVFRKDGFAYTAIAAPYYGTIWATRPEFVNAEGHYSYTTAILLKFQPDEEAYVFNRDERPLQRYKCCYECNYYHRESRNCGYHWDGIHDIRMNPGDTCESWTEIKPESSISPSGETYLDSGEYYIG